MENGEEQQGREHMDESQNIKVDMAAIPMFTLPQSVTDKLKKQLNVRFELSSQAKANLDKAWWSAQNTPAYKSSIERINISVKRSGVAKQTQSMLFESLGPLLSAEKNCDLESAVTKGSPEETQAVQKAAVEHLDALEEELGQDALDAEADNFIDQNPEALVQVERLGFLEHLDNDPQRRKRIAYLIGLYVTILLTFGIASVSEQAPPETQQLISSSGLGGLTGGAITTAATKGWLDKRAKRSQEEDGDEEEEKSP